MRPKLVNGAQKVIRSRAYVGDIFQKTVFSERQIRVLKTVLQNFKTKKPLLKGLFWRRVILASKGMALR